MTCLSGATAQEECTSTSSCCSPHPFPDAPFCPFPAGLSKSIVLSRKEPPGRRLWGEGQVEGQLGSGYSRPLHWTYADLESRGFKSCPELAYVQIHR